MRELHKSGKPGYKGSKGHPRKGGKKGGKP